MEMIKKVYRYKLDESLNTSYPDINFKFKNEWTEIENGVLTVKSKYAWDGCTPARSILGLFIVSTPNGHIYYKTGKPFTYYSSLFHDVLYQFNIGDRKIADKIFLDLLPKEFILRKFYYYILRMVGWINFSKKK